MRRIFFPILIPPIVCTFITEYRVMNGPFVVLDVLEATLNDVTRVGCSRTECHSHALP